jgi:hypothetical protein
VKTIPAILIFWLLAVILFSCAVKEAPSGGPEDTTAPVIIGVKPEPGSVGIPLDTRFHIMFSKSMDSDKTINAVFLSPVFWEYPEYKWNGKELTVIPPEDLDSGKTYVLTVGSGATGEHGNQMGTSYSFAYSTGSVIDSGRIAGSVYLDQGKSTAYDIWAYLYIPGDTALFLTDIPDYATQIDSLGSFDMMHIAPGEYMVIAIDDRNDDLFWDPAAESIALPPLIIELARNAIFDGLVLYPGRRDTIQAEISRARPIDDRKIVMELSQPVLESMKLDTSHYYIVSPESSFLNVEGLYLGAEGKLMLETAAQRAESIYYLKPRGLVSLWGNSFDSSGARFAGSQDTDSVGPELLSADPGRSSRAVYQNDHIDLTFSERIKTLGFSNAVAVIADSMDTLSFTPQWTAPNVIRLTFGGKIPREKKIEVVLNPAGIFDIAGNPMADSSLSFGFRITPADTVGSVVIKTGKSGNVVGELSPKAGGNPSYREHSDDLGVFNFNSVFPGVYFFRYFEDSDSNGIWSPGIIVPFEPAEWFYFYRDSIDVRSRWTTELGRIDGDSDH